MAVSAGPNLDKHRAATLFTSYACPETAGVNLLLQVWVFLAREQAVVGVSTFLLVGEAIQVAARETEILDAPKGVRTWTPLPHLLPIRASQSISEKDVVTLGAQVHDYMRSSAFQIHLKAMSKLF